MVTVRALLGEPTANVLLNAIELGETVTGATGVPVTLTDVVPTLNALNAIWNVPVSCTPRALVSDGVNATVIVHVRPAGIPAAQLSVSPNWVFVDVIVTISVTVLLLRTVNVLEGLVCPIATEPKERDVGVTVMGWTPVPCRATDMVARL